MANEGRCPDGEDALVKENRQMKGKRLVKQIVVKKENTVMKETP